MTLFKITTDGNLNRMCPDHPHMALKKEPVLLLNGGYDHNWWRCPIDHALYQDRPESGVSPLSRR